MSDVADFFADAYTGLLDTFGMRHKAEFAKHFFGNSIIADEYDKAPLRGTEVESFLSGLPIIGGVVRGIEGINQLEDLYDRTGKTVAYPSQVAGASGLGHALTGVTRKIEDGVHDLGSFYAGEDMLPIPSSQNQLMYGWNQRNYHIRKW